MFIVFTYDMVSCADLFVNNFEANCIGIYEIPTSTPEAPIINATWN